MSSRLVVPLVCTAAIVFACGPRDRSAIRSTIKPTPVSGHASAPVTAARPHHRAPGDTSAVGADFAVLQGADGIRLELAVVNRGKHKVEIDFPDGRTRDFVVVDAAGKEVWRWSKGRLFTQTVQNKFLAAGDTTVYDERWRDAAPGTYTAIATLRSNNYPVERRATFSVGVPAVAVAAH